MNTDLAKHTSIGDSSMNTAPSVNIDPRKAIAEEHYPRTHAVANKNRSVGLYLIGIASNRIYSNPI